MSTHPEEGHFDRILRWRTVAKVVLTHNIKALGDREMLRAAVDRHVRERDRLAEDLALLDQDIAQDAIEDSAVNRLMTITGVNLAVAVGIMAAIGDISGSTTRRLVSYFGLTQARRRRWRAAARRARAASGQAADGASPCARSRVPSVKPTSSVRPSGVAPISTRMHCFSSSRRAWRWMPSAQM